MSATGAVGTQLQNADVVRDRLAKGKENRGER